MRGLFRNIWLLTLLVLSCETMAQSRVKQILRTGRVSDWNDFLNSPWLQFSGSKISREIIPGYFEEHVNLTEKFGNEFISHEVDVLIHGQKIIYWATDKPPVNIIRQYDTDSFVNQGEFEKFGVAFKNKYGRALNKRDLFNHTVYSLNICGLPEGETMESKQLEIIMRQKDTSVPEKWLRSANVEKQLYAIYAFKQYEKRNIPISPATWDIINYVGQKEGNVQCCEGCSWFDREIRFVFSHPGLH